MAAVAFWPAPAAPDAAKPFLADDPLGAAAAADGADTGTSAEPAAGATGSLGIGSLRGAGL